MGVRVRPMREDDEDAVLELIAEISRESPVVAGRIAAMVGTFGHLRLVAEADGVIVGRAALVRTPMMPPGTIAAGVGVRASSRRTGVGGALWDQLVGDLPAGTDRLLGFSDDRDDAEVLPWVTARGLAPFQHSLRVTLDLRALPPLDPLPADVTIEMLDPGTTRDDPEVAALYAESDTSPEAEAIGPISWPDELDALASPGSALLCLVHVRGRPVAMTLAQESDQQRWDVMYTGVHPDSRGHGLAMVAKQHLHQSLAGRGATHVASDNEAENAGMRRVNEKLGYVRTRGTRRFARDLIANPLR